MYKTTDLYLAAYLKSQGNKIEIERKENKCIFVFEKIKEENVNGFYNNDKVGVTDYKNALMDLKSMIYNRGY